MSNTRTDLRKRAERELALARSQVPTMTLQLMRHVEASGMTLRELSRRSGVPASSLSRLMSGRGISTDSLDAIALVLDLHIAKRGI